jgi:hypothetical protein
MNFIKDCVTCQRLWREYSAATAEHIKLEGKLKIAALSRETGHVSELTVFVEKAAAERVAARRAIAEHQWATHEAGDAAAAEA